MRNLLLFGLIFGAANLLSISQLEANCKANLEELEGIITSKEDPKVLLGIPQLLSPERLRLLKANRTISDYAFLHDDSVVAVSDSHLYFVQRDKDTDKLSESRTTLLGRSANRSVHSPRIVATYNGRDTQYVMIQFEKSGALTKALQIWTLERDKSKPFSRTLNTSDQDLDWQLADDQPHFFRNPPPRIFSSRIEDQHDLNAVSSIIEISDNEGVSYHVVFLKNGHFFVIDSWSARPVELSKRRERSSTEIIERDAVMLGVFPSLVKGQRSEVLSVEIDESETGDLENGHERFVVKTADGLTHQLELIAVSRGESTGFQVEIFDIRK